MKADLVGHVEVGVAWQVILMVFGQIGFVVGLVNLAYVGPLDCLIAALARMEAEVAMELPYHYLATLDSEQAGLAIAVLVVRPEPQLDSGHQIHVALESVPWCISDRS